MSETAKSTLTQKYTIIQLLESVPEGAQFGWTAWPLHSTLVDVFAVDWSSSELIEELETLSVHTPASSVAIEDAFFGPEQETQVVLLEKTDALVKLHCDVIEILSKGRFKPNNPQFVLDGFLPHATVQKHARLNEGDIVTFDALTLIDMFPDSDPYQRKVLRTVKIGNKII
jgi:2'-5' RNA ligase